MSNKDVYYSMKLKKALPLSFVFLFVIVFTTQTVFAKSYRIRSSDNISRIVDKFYANRTLSKQQVMVGLLSRNPRAFKGGNVNFLLRGRRIQLPKESEMPVISDADAKAILSQHNSFFRRGRTGVGKLPKLGGKSRVTSAKVTATNMLNQPIVSVARQSEQIAKIKRLETETKALKLQLDRLLEARKERDKKLLELERSINQSLEEEKKKTVIPH